MFVSDYSVVVGLKENYEEGTCGEGQGGSRECAEGNRRFRGGGLIRRKVRLCVSVRVGMEAKKIKAKNRRNACPQTQKRK